MLLGQLKEMYDNGLLKAAYIFPVDANRELWGISCHAVDGQSFTMVKYVRGTKKNGYDVRHFATVHAAYSSLNRIGFQQMLVTDKEPKPSETDMKKLQNVKIKKPRVRRNVTPDLLTGVALSA